MALVLPQSHGAVSHHRANNPTKIDTIELVNVFLRMWDGKVGSVYTARSIPPCFGRSYLCLFSDSLLYDWPEKPEHNKREPAWESCHGSISWQQERLLLCVTRKTNQSKELWSIEFEKWLYCVCSISKSRRLFHHQFHNSLHHNDSGGWEHLHMRRFPPCCTCIATILVHSTALLFVERDPFFCAVTHPATVTMNQLIRRLNNKDPVHSKGSI